MSEIVLFNVVQNWKVTSSCLKWEFRSSPSIFSSSGAYVKEIHRSKIILWILK
ncbi:hypothetical protein CPK_ORF00865 [Chlamydia pneumoniae LPCoLN]|nr:hypothetical protein CPK_ORF00865 [Chlamydia pneumoniae LPCoLN]